MPAKKLNKKSSKKTIAVLRHSDKRRNLPTVEFQEVMQEEEKTPIEVAYERRNRDLDPQLVWRGKDEQDWSDLVVPCAASLHSGKDSSESTDRRSSARIDSTRD